MESIWNKTVEIPVRNTLAGDLTTDVAIVGGGLSGILIAYFLQQQGRQVTVLEADRIGSGQTGNTTAKITSQHNLIYSRLIRTQGEEKARQYAHSAQKAINEYRSIIEKLNIDCDFEECPSYLYSLTNSERLRKEAAAAISLGIPAKFTQNTTLPFSIEGAIRFEGQAQFHPLKFLIAMAESLTIYEHTKVKSVKDMSLITDKGTVTARHIVFACHYPFVNFPGFYFIRMFQERSYALALKNAAPLDGMYLGIDDDFGFSFRTYKDMLLLGDCSHRTGKIPEQNPFEQLRKAAAGFYKESSEAACWAAQDCMTLDGVPYIGCFSRAKPNWYVATGFEKWGMTTSMTAALILSDLISGHKNPYEDVFSPKRLHLLRSSGSIAVNGYEAISGMSKLYFKAPKKALDALKNGCGGIISHEGHKTGAYKDHDGKVFLVSTRCPHLGCQLEWNAAELSWDCPCHGSRFDYKGKLLDNPAQEDITHDSLPRK